MSIKFTSYNNPLIFSHKYQICFNAYIYDPFDEK